MATERQNFSNRKSQWKKSTSLLYRDIEKLLIKVRAGEIVTMGDVYEQAHRVHRQGERSIDLAREAAALYMREHVLKEIHTDAHLLELYSKQLYNVLIRRELPTVGYPLYESTLVYDVVVDEEDPLSSLETIMGGNVEIDRGIQGEDNSVSGPEGKAS